MSKPGEDYIRGLKHGQKRLAHHILETIEGGSGMVTVIAILKEILDNEKYVS